MKTRVLNVSGNYVAKLRQLFPNKVYGVNVRSAKSNGDPTVRVNEGAGIVTIDKLTQNKILMNDIKAGRFWFWKKDDEELEMIIEHAKNVVIRDIQDEKTNQVEQVIGRRGAD